MTYEAARSVNGPFLAILGGGGLLVGLTAGLGELLGYGLRIPAGLLSDKTRQYWAITIAGYAINLLAVPALALAHHWGLAAGLMVTERIGKALRTPARDTMLSHATATVGRGWGFAVHEAMDQIGAVIGPLIVMAVLAVNGSYRYAFAVLAIPAVLAMSVLVFARLTYPSPEKFETHAASDKPTGLPSVFWLYLGSIAFVAAGFVDFPLIAFHVKSHSILEDRWIPLLYAGAMGIDALSALVFGRWYDKKRLAALMAAIAISSASALLAFSFTAAVIIGGVLLWGIGMGAQESIIRAFVADIVPLRRRGTGYGLFNAGYGVAWFVGSAVLGFLYDISLPALIAVSVCLQLVSLPLLHQVRRRLAGQASATA
jgi:MFS family permease